MHSIIYKKMYPDSAFEDRDRSSCLLSDTCSHHRACTCFSDITDTDSSDEGCQNLARKLGKSEEFASKLRCIGHKGTKPDEGTMKLCCAL